MNGQMQLVKMFAAYIADACIPSIYEAIDLTFLMTIYVCLSDSENREPMLLKLHKRN
jgi:hypothetical protein